MTFMVVSLMRMGWLLNRSCCRNDIILCLLYNLWHTLCGRHCTAEEMSSQTKGRGVPSFRWVKFVLRSAPGSSATLCLLSMLRAASPHRGRADSHLLQVTHWLEISTSYNPTSEDPKYHFNIEHISEIFTRVFNLFFCQNIEPCITKERCLWRWVRLRLQMPTNPDWENNRVITRQLSGRILNSTTFIYYYFRVNALLMSVDITECKPKNKLISHPVNDCFGPWLCVDIILDWLSGQPMSS